jgi:hypothetical protein
MTTATLDFDALLVGVPMGSWVAVSTDMARVVAYGDDLQAVLDKAKSLGEGEPVVMRVPDPTVAMIL